MPVSFDENLRPPLPNFYCQMPTTRALPLSPQMGSPPPRPHAVLIPQPAQGHVTPMLQLAKILHSQGFYITYVNSEYNHKRLRRSQGADSLKGLEDFRFEAIPDGLPPSDDDDVTQDIAELCISTTKNSLVPFRDLLIRLGNSPGVPAVSCVIADGVMSFAQWVAEKMGILALVFWTTSACGFMGYLHFSELIRRGYTPLKGKLVANLFLFYKNFGMRKLEGFPIFIATLKSQQLQRLEI